MFRIIEYLFYLKVLFPLSIIWLAILDYVSARFDANFRILISDDVRKMGLLLLGAGLLAHYIQDKLTFDEMLEVCAWGVALEIVGLIVYPVRDGSADLSPDSNKTEKVDGGGE